MSSPEPSKDELRALWEAGVPLNSAWVEFAKFSDRFLLRALRTFPANDPDLLAPDPRYKELIEWLPRTWEARQQKLAATTESERMNLLDEIYTDQLWAIGFRTLPNGGDEPVRVPRRLFLVSKEPNEKIPSKIDWNREELRDGDTCYFDIRIIRSASNENAETRQFEKDSTPVSPQADSATEKPARAAHVGRRNTRDEIRRKVEELLKTDEFQAIPNRGDQAREVRARLRGEKSRFLDDLPNYRSTTIQRIIGEVANQSE